MSALRYAFKVFADTLRLARDNPRQFRTLLGLRLYSDQARLHGETLGLTDEQCNEVIWRVAEQRGTSSHLVIPWDEVKQRMTLRATGQEWRP